MVAIKNMDRIEARQASFLAAPALTRRKEQMEKERKRLREAGAARSSLEIPTGQSGNNAHGLMPRGSDWRVASK